MELIHHYTSIDTLDSILSSKKIKFNRLDNVDDLTESSAYNKLNLGQYLFVSCWTNSINESIPLWDMYAKGMTGIRISLPRNVLNYRELDIPKYWEGIVTQGKLLSPMLLDQIFTNDYFIVPFFLDKDHIEHEVEYIDNINDIFKDMVKLDIGTDGKYKIKIAKTYNLAKYKNKEWQFQDEFRFVLFIVPSLVKLPEEGPANKEYCKKLANQIGNNLINQLPLKINCFDVDISPEALNDIMITMGPKTSNEDKVRVEALLKKYTAGGKCCNSKLKGTIK